MSNKDLDLPTQQELLAQYRCDEIAAVAFEAFLLKIKGFRQPIEAGKIIDDLGPSMGEIRDTTISKSIFFPFLYFCHDRRLIINIINDYNDNCDL